MFEIGLLLLLRLVLIALTAWALVDAAIRPAAAYPAAGKLTKPAWLGITAVAALIALFTTALGLFGIVAAVASIVYLTDVRPAVRELGSGGPYG